MKSWVWPAIAIAALSWLFIAAPSPDLEVHVPERLEITHRVIISPEKPVELIVKGLGDIPPIGIPERITVTVRGTPRAEVVVSPAP